MKDALTYTNEGTAIYDLAGDTFAVPVVLTDGPKNWKLFVQFKTPSREVLTDVLNQVKTTEVQTSGDEVVERVISGDAALQKFVLGNFLNIVGVVAADGNPLPLEKQIKFFEANRGNVTVLTGVAAVLNVQRPQIDATEESSEFLVFEEESDFETIPMEVMLADVEKKKSVPLTVVQQLRMASEAQRSVYRKAAKSKGLREGRQIYSWTTTNYTTIEKLYAELVIGLEGAAFEGAACTEQNRDLWLPKTPVSWKAYALNRLFNQIESKNG